MMKNKSIIIFVFLMFIFYKFDTVKAYDTNVIEKPIASEIVYGQPLLESHLDGGVARVAGTFRWKNELEVLSAGNHKITVIFSPNSQEFLKEEFEIDLKVNKRRAYIMFEKEIYKQYDGSNTIKLPNFVVCGIIEDDVFVRGELKGTLDNVLIGENINIILEGIELVGENSNNYLLDLSGFKATIHPSYIEKFGKIKNRIDFSKNVYVPIDSLLHVDKEVNVGLHKENYKIKEVYDIYLQSSLNRVEIDDLVRVKIKIDESSINGRKIKVYNYYNDNYDEVKYKYENGYLIYNVNHLGKLVIAQKKFSLWWLYILTITLAMLLIGIVIYKNNIVKRKINRYKSLKRSKDNEDYL